MRLTGESTPGTMNSSSSGSGNFLLVPIPEYPLLDCVPNKTVKIVVLGASNVGKTGTGNLEVHLILARRQRKGHSMWYLSQNDLIYMILTCWTHLWGKLVLRGNNWVREMKYRGSRDVWDRLAILNDRGRHLFRYICVLNSNPFLHIYNWFNLVFYVLWYWQGRNATINMWHVCIANIYSQFYFKEQKKFKQRKPRLYYYYYTWVFLLPLSYCIDVEMFKVIYNR